MRITNYSSVFKESQVRQSTIAVEKFPFTIDQLFNGQLRVEEIFIDAERCLYEDSKDS